DPGQAAGLNRKWVRMPVWPSRVTTLELRAPVKIDLAWIRRQTRQFALTSPASTQPRRFWPVFGALRHTPPNGMADVFKTSPSCQRQRTQSGRGPWTCAPVAGDQGAAADQPDFACRIRVQHVRDLAGRDFDAAGKRDPRGARPSRSDAGQCGSHPLLHGDRGGTVARREDDQRIPPAERAVLRRDAELPETAQGAPGLRLQGSDAQSDQSTRPRNRLGSGYRAALPQ